MQIFVGNLSFTSTEADIKKLFEQFGSVTSITLLMDKNGKKSRGFGFVEMSDEQNAQAAIAGLDSKEFMGRALKVMVARPKPVKEPVVEEKKEPRFRPVTETRRDQRRENFREEVRFKPRPVAKKPSRFKGGRRSTSYLRRMSGRTDEQFQSTQEPTGRPWQKRRSYAKPWVKPGEHPKPWQKSEDQAKPWRKTEGRAKPWEKSERPAKPWKKSEDRDKPWQKPMDKPWHKSSGSAPRTRFKNRKKNKERF